MSYPTEAERTRLLWDIGSFDTETSDGRRGLQRQGAARLRIYEEQIRQAALEEAIAAVREANGDQDFLDDALNVARKLEERIRAQMAVRLAPYDPRLKIL